MRKERVIVEATGLVELEDLAWLESNLASVDPEVRCWIGVECSWKRLAAPDAPGTSSPSLAQLQEMLSSGTNRRLSFCVHYTPAHPSTAAAEMLELARRVPALPNAHAVQVNSCPSRELHRLRTAIPCELLIAQVPLYRMDDQAVSTWLADLGTSRLVDGILLDGSGGKGSSTQRSRMSSWRSRIASNVPIHILGMAGGYVAADLRAVVCADRGPTPLFDCTSGVRSVGRFSCELARDWYLSAMHISFQTTYQEGK